MIGWSEFTEDQFDRSTDFLEKQEAFKKLPKQIEQKHMAQAILGEMKEDLSKVEEGLESIMWRDAVPPRDALRNLYDHLIDMCAYLSAVSERD